MIRTILRAQPVVVALLFLLTSPGQTQDLQSPADPAWSVPQMGALPYDAAGMLVRRGYDLITATYAHIGPSVADEAKRYAGNNLACSNCHLNAGTKKFGIPLWGLKDLFPQYSFEAGKEISIEDRVNSCMTRSMNGKPLPVNSQEMKAFVAYIDFLSTGAKRGEILSGLGAGKMPELKRAADPVRGKAVYEKSLRAVPSGRRPRCDAQSAICRISATSIRRSGGRTASTTAPAWRR